MHYRPIVKGESRGKGSGVLWVIATVVVAAFLAFAWATKQLRHVSVPWQSREIDANPRDDGRPFDQGLLVGLSIEFWIVLAAFVSFPVSQDDADTHRGPARN